MTTPKDKSVYPLGQRVRLRGNFYTLPGQPADPTAVTLQYRRPSGEEVELVYGEDAALIRESLGRYYVELDLDESDDWHYRWSGTGLITVADEHRLYVKRSQF